MTDIILAILSIVLLFAGLAGAVLPIPGPPLSLAGLFCLHYSKYANFDNRTLIVFTILTVAMSILDYYAPIWGTKKFGGTKFGVWGSTIGLLVGLFFIPAIGMFIGAFAGALIGELIGGTSFDRAVKAAVGSFIGLATGIVGKVLLCLAMLILGGVALGEYLVIVLG